MAIRVTLDRVLLDRRMSLTELGDRVGITLANLSILKTGKAKAIRFSTLEALWKLSSFIGPGFLSRPGSRATPSRGSRASRCR